MSTILGYSSNFDQQIQKLFANGEQGFFYYPSDMGTMFQDAAGTIPTTTGQPVGLMLDKSKGLVLGSELIPQPLNFNAWVKTGAVTSFTGNSFTSSAAGGCTLSVFGANNTKTHIFKLKGNSTVAGALRNSTAGGVGLSIPIGSFDLTFISPLVSTVGSSIYIALIGAGTLTIDSISIKELTGNHAYQATSAARPILRDTPRRIYFDAVDDKLTTTFPAQLTGCTVVRSIPNVGTQILTGQTIPTPYNNNTDHCGLIVINRALTASETSQITKLFNKSAGV